jgi:hypothetical protein
VLIDESSADDATEALKDEFFAGEGKVLGHVAARYLDGGAWTTRATGCRPPSSVAFRS